MREKEDLFTCVSVCVRARVCVCVTVSVCGDGGGGGGGGGSGTYCCEGPVISFIEWLLWVGVIILITE